MKKLYSILIAAFAFVYLPRRCSRQWLPRLLIQNVLDAINRIPPAWSQILPATERFVLVMSGAGVLDKETGLVWEQSPDKTTPKNWVDAQIVCNVKAVGNRKGWRLPTVHELASLIDPSNAGGDPDLPVGHPFSDVLAELYWSATTDAGDSARAWEVNFDFFPLAGGPEAMVKTAENFVWCVRGGLGVDTK